MQARESDARMNRCEPCNLKESLEDLIQANWEAEFSELVMPKPCLSDSL